MSPTCRFCSEEEEATHEYRKPDATRWSPVCEEHAEAFFHVGADVRALDTEEVEAR